MKKIIILIIAISAILALQANNLYVLNSGSHTLSNINLETQQINNTFLTVGLYSNQIFMENNNLWIVNSGDNNCKKYDPANASLLNTIQLEASANPWNIVKKDNYLYISGLMSGKIYRYNTENSQIDFLESGIGPEGMLIINNNLYVANTGFQYPNYLPGKVSVIDLNTFTKTTDINVGTNPQALILGSDNNIHVVGTGNYSSETGKVFIINPQTNTLVQTINVGLAPNNIFESPDHKIYMADGNGLGFIVYNTADKQIVHSSENPYLPGASKIIFNNQNKIALYTGDWQSNSQVKILDQNDQILNTYSVAIGAVDILLNGNGSSTDNPNDIISVNTLKTYPNPFKDNVNIKSENQKVNEISIYNLKGEKVRTFSSNNAQWDTKNQHGLKCANGIYFVIAKSGHTIIEKKAITLLK